MGGYIQFKQIRGGGGGGGDRQYIHDTLTKLEECYENHSFPFSSLVLSEEATCSSWLPCSTTTLSRVDTSQRETTMSSEPHTGHTGTHREGSSVALVLILSPLPLCSHEETYYGQAS